MSDTNKDGLIAQFLQNQTALFRRCKCYPEHCTHNEYCWCEPKIKIAEDGSKIIIHNEAN